ncbi:MAG: hypothetical protein QG553_842 [Patescibacteria group bacterium]|nr:hypothetical protein [Patescibacteria group bacterium]
MSDLPVAIRLEEFVPEACVGCDTAYEACRVMAREVVGHNVAIDAAGAQLALELTENCSGAARIAIGWAATEQRCRNRLVV